MLTQNHRDKLPKFKAPDTASATKEVNQQATNPPSTDEQRCIFMTSDNKSDKEQMRNQWMADLAAEGHICNNELRAW